MNHNAAKPAATLVKTLEAEIPTVPVRCLMQFVQIAEKLAKFRLSREKTVLYTAANALQQADHNLSATI